MGDHVAKIQHALLVLGDVGIEPSEREDKRYGPSTASAVLSYKKKRQIINQSYQAQADNIVGIMTMAALDKEMVQSENGPRRVVTTSCVVGTRSDSGRRP